MSSFISILGQPHRILDIVEDSPIARHASIIYLGNPVASNLALSRLLWLNEDRSKKSEHETGHIRCTSIVFDD